MLLAIPQKLIPYVVAQTTDYSQAINGLSGSFDLHCPPMPPLNGTGNVTSCGFKASQFVTVFGLPSPRLTGCLFGECVSNDVVKRAPTGEVTFDARSGDMQSLAGSTLATWIVVLLSLGLVVI
jgi:hypothetical protein